MPMLSQILTKVTLSRIQIMIYLLSCIEVNWNARHNALSLITIQSMQTSINGWSAHIQWVNYLHLFMLVFQEKNNNPEKLFSGSNFLLQIRISIFDPWSLRERDYHLELGFRQQVWLSSLTVNLSREITSHF